MNDPYLGIDRAAAYKAYGSLVQNWLRIKKSSAQLAKLKPNIYNL